MYHEKKNKTLAGGVYRRKNSRGKGQNLDVDKGGDTESLLGWGKDYMATYKVGLGKKSYQKR